MYLNLAEAVVNGATGHNAAAALAELAANRNATAATVTKNSVLTER